MKLSQGFWQTYKEVPSDAEIVSHQLMLRAGLILKTSSGLYTHLPMGLRIIQKFEKIVRQELNKIDCYELLPPFVTPGELWKESGRWDSMGPEMLRATDRSNKDLCLSPTNEESFTDVFRKTVKSYKQLPLRLYQINTKYRDEIRPRYGLMRCKEFIMKDAYTFHLDKKCLDVIYDQMYKAYENIFVKAGLNFIAVEADPGTMATSDAKTHEFQVLALSGEDKVIKCKSCSYAANLEKASTLVAAKKENKGQEKRQKVQTPNQSTIEQVCSYLKCTKSECLKALCFSVPRGEKVEVVLTILSGDDELNELKLQKHLSEKLVYQSKDSELLKQNLVKGYIGPVEQSLRIIIDESIDLEGSYICGANEVDTHFKNVVPKRDISKYETADLRLAKQDDLCPLCKNKVEQIRGVEVGHIFQLGTKYTQSMGVSVLDPSGKATTPLMGCYGIGITRTVAAAVEQHHDANGIIWPRALAPYDVYFAVITKDSEFLEFATEIYEAMKDDGLEVLFDDRNVGPGFKFKDADLLGLPLRVTLGQRDYNKDECFEIVVRKTQEKIKVKKDKLLSTLSETLEKL